MHRHLIAVEVGVEGRADQRVETDRFPLDQHRIERLDAQPVEGGSPVQQDGMLTNDFVQHVPHLRTLFLDQPLGALDRGRRAAFLQLVKDERLEQFQRHLLR